jgi:DNA mismatch endonuclease, patch repair protein
MQGSSDDGFLGSPTSLPLAPADPAVRARFRQQLREGTRPEMSLRRELHRRGRRFRVQYAVAGLPRRRVDIAFPKQHLAVFVDGCFWHGCPIHFIAPHANREWWLAKIAVNTARDRDTDERLLALGWVPLRLWEHVPSQVAADEVTAKLEGIAPTARTVGPDG